MQYYLLNTAICEILVSASTFLAQCRPVANKTTLAVFCYGPCKHFGPNTCFFMFALVQASVVAASFSILLSFYYRYRLLQVHVKNARSHKKTIAIFSLLPTSMLGLLLQTMVPFVVYIPPFTYVLVSQFTGHSSLYAEYLLNTLGSFTAFINPLLTFYYVLPYRRALCKRVFKYFPSVSEEGTDITTYPAAANFHRGNTAITKV
ncbi:hypothetical protein B9Z55_026141 [Caenorhabditis nigoni]|nr:hypothetical protein B9Z55_026141 [Caenorhabditis nigoni]